MQRPLCLHVLHVCPARSSRWVEQPLRQQGWLLLLPFLGVTEHGRGGKVGVHYLLPLEFPGFPSVCLYVPTSAQLSVCPQPALALLGNRVSAHWSGGGKGREAPGQRRQTHTSVAASDWTHQRSWWMRLTIVSLTGCWRALWVLTSSPSVHTRWSPSFLCHKQWAILLFTHSDKRAGEF